MEYEVKKLQRNSHDRTIIHLDMDCFYAQVEELRNPELRLKPLGVQQKQFVVTCNYIARQFGVTKLMAVTEAKKLCPDLVLVNGEDLSNYRQMSTRIFELLQKYTPLVEKLGLDEDFIDVTQLVVNRSKENMDVQVEGLVHPLNQSLENSCECGCYKRLAIGTHIAKEIRDELFISLGITCCAGISYNKLLAKLVGSRNKPNNQTVLISSYAEEFMRELSSLHSLTGIGHKTESLLLENGIANVTELQNCDFDMLKKKLGYETASKLKDLSFGRDYAPVRPSGKPKTISLEDSCRSISVKTDIEEKFRMLLMRLIEQVSEDGRIPIAVKVVLRKFDPIKKTSHRETKQANISASLFKITSNGQLMLSEDALSKLLKIIMRLFERVVDLEKPFNITLIGLAFSKFQHRKLGSSSIASYLIKKTDVEVQSVTSITNDDTISSSPQSFHPGDQYYRRRTTASPTPMSIDFETPASDISDISETEIEPSPKKSCLGLLIATRRCFPSGDVNDIASPSKLRVSDLRLNSRDSEKDICMSPNANSMTILPPSSHKPELTLLKTLTMDNECRDINMCCDTTRTSTTQTLSSTLETAASNDSSSIITKATITGNLSNIPCPSGVDQSVFNELPIEVQNELINSWRNSMSAKVNATTNNSISTNGTMAGGEKNTLYRYFMRHK